MHDLTPQQAMVLGIQHHQAGQLAEAEAIYRQVLAHLPRHPEALHLLGMIAFQVRQFDTAIQLINQACAIDPKAHHFRCNLGQALAASDRLDDAIESYRAAIYLNPNYANSHFLLGNALHLAGRSQEAIESFRRALAIDPSHADALGSLGGALHAAGKYDDAIQSLREALRIQPQHAVAEHNLALTLLLLGNFEQGWRHYEARHRATATSVTPGEFTQPQWAGEPLNGRTILLHTEQGFGDAIQFARYAPLVAQRGGTVLLRCRPELARLFKTLAGVQQIIPRGEALPHFDFHCPLLTLPLVMGTTALTIPADIPYLNADPKPWGDRLLSNVFKIGIAWAGLSRHVNDRNRSLSFESLSSLGQIDDVRVFSLQKQNQPIDQPWLTDWTNEFTDFADTAGFILSLDLVITVDTAVAHLAGALGKPVWVLLPLVPDWRWQLNRDDSPWYPTMRLFRQTSAGDWTSVVQNVIERLKRVVAGEISA